jgi:hypothetical protein
MKAQFKYAFLAGLDFRLPAFAVIFIKNTVFIILGSFGLLPFAALITSVALGGVAIAVMFAANIGGDIMITRRMFYAPEAYLHALTPAPRWKILLASIVTMAVMDILTMAFVIASQVWLVFNLAGFGYWQIVWETISSIDSFLFYGILSFLFVIAGYFLLIMIILFSITMKKSVFFKIPASGLLAFLVACVCFYAVSLLQLVLIPFSTVERYLFMITVTPDGGMAIPLLILLTLLEAAGLFILTSKLMEKKVNL